MSFGLGSFGFGALGVGGISSLEVVSAVALNPFTVRVTFSDEVNPTQAATTSIDNYAIPGLTIVKVTLDLDDLFSVRVFTSTQTHALYEVGVSDQVQDNEGNGVSSAANSVEFTGWPASSSFIATAVSATAVQVVFAQAMTNDSALIDPANYTLQTLNGAPVSVLSATPNTLVGPTRVTLRLGASLPSGIPHTLHIASTIVTVTGLLILPPDTLVTWAQKILRVSVPLSKFTGEVKEGAVGAGVDPTISNLFGNPDGLVFFSPSLITGGAPNSSIQVDDVSACTRSYDVYTFPQPVDPTPIFTHGGGLVPTPTLTTLNNAVLFVEFYRLAEAKHVLGDTRTDTLPASSDIGMSITLTEVFPPTWAALLNNTSWSLFDGAAPPPYPFITANNLIPLPAPTVAPKQYYVNPLEVIGFTESLSASMTATASVADTVGLLEVFDLQPGATVVQVNVTESVTVGDAVALQQGINLFETIAFTEGLTVLP